MQQSSKERRPPSKRPMKKKLEGKTFYLDNVKKQPLILLSETINALGGRVESFLHKDVDYVVTGSKEDPKEKPAATKGAVKDETKEDKRQTAQQERSFAGDKRPGTPRPAACGSRGKALLEKAIRNNERLQASSVLSSARSWGVKILSVDHALLYLKKLNKERCTVRQSPPVMKATVLKTPHLKVEDVSRKYKPLFTLYATFPALHHLSKNPPRQSPPPPPWYEHWAEHGENKTREKKAESSKFQTSLNLPWLIGKKNTSYCECCQQVFTCLKQHLESDQHHKFAMDQANYSAVDQVVAEMFPVFDSAAFQRTEESANRTPTPLPVDDFCDVELHLDESQQDFFLNSLSVDVTVGFPPGESPGVQPAEPKREDVAAETNSFTPQLSVTLPPALNAQAPPSRPPQCSPHGAASAALPPVLSPEIPFSCFHSSFSDPPVLCPQQFAASEERDCEMNFFDVVSEFIAAFAAPSSCENGGSRSVSTTANPKKRRGSASEQHGSRKRRRRVPPSPRLQRDEKREFEEAGPPRTPSDPTLDVLDFQQTPSTSPHDQIDSSSRPPSSKAAVDPPLDFTSSEIRGLLVHHHDSRRSSLAHNASVCIEQSLIPDPAALSSPSSDSEWDSGLLSRLGPPPAACPTPAGPSGELDKELLHRPCPWTYDRGYESHLHTILQQAAPPCADDKDISPFSKSVAQTAEVQ